MRRFILTAAEIVPDGGEGEQQGRCDARDSFAVAGYEALSGIVVVEETEDQSIGMVSLRFIFQGSLQLSDHLRRINFFGLIAPEIAPCPLPQVFCPIIGRVKPVVEIVWVAGAGFRQKQ